MFVHTVGILTRWEHDSQAVINYRQDWDDDVALEEFEDDRTGIVGLSSSGGIVSHQRNDIQPQRVDAHED